MLTTYSPISFARIYLKGVVERVCTKTISRKMAMWPWRQFFIRIHWYAAWKTRTEKSYRCTDRYNPDCFMQRKLHLELTWNYFLFVIFVRRSSMLRWSKISANWLLFSPLTPIFSVIADVKRRLSMKNYFRLHRGFRPIPRVGMLDAIKHPTYKRNFLMKNMRNQ